MFGKKFLMLNHPWDSQIQYGRWIIQMGFTMPLIKRNYFAFKTTLVLNTPTAKIGKYLFRFESMTRLITFVSIKSWNSISSSEDFYRTNLKIFEYVFTCSLVLNIYAPPVKADKTTLPNGYPVLFFIHGYVHICVCMISLFVYICVCTICSFMGTFIYVYV